MEEMEEKREGECVSMCVRETERERERGVRKSPPPPERADS